MSEKRLCPVCDAYLSYIYRTGYCPNGCLDGLHRYERGWEGFCSAEMLHRDAAEAIAGGKSIPGGFALVVVSCSGHAEDKIHTLYKLQADPEAGKEARRRALDVIEELRERGWADREIREFVEAALANPGIGGSGE